ncbi:hypothetical protein BH10BAC1_BH10BAC1_18030 [soil metagenome]
MYFVYILFSEKLNKYYTGYTKDLEQRLMLHNKGQEAFTSKGIPWSLRYFEQFDIELNAIRREREIKAKKSRKYIEWIIATKAQ